MRDDADLQANCRESGVANPSGLYIRATVQDRGYQSAQTLVNLEELDIRGTAPTRIAWAICNESKFVSLKPEPKDPCRFGTEPGQAIGAIKGPDVRW